MSTGKRLVTEALGDSYYPDLGQSVNAERMIELIDTDPLIAAAPEMLEALKEALRVADRETSEFDAVRAAIAKAEGAS